MERGFTLNETDNEACWITTNYRFLLLLLLAVIVVKYMQLQGSDSSSDVIQVVGKASHPSEYPFVVTPVFFETLETLSEEERKQQIAQWRKEKHLRAQEAYGYERRYVIVQFENPVFKNMFPETDMYTVHVGPIVGPPNLPSYATMVSRQNKDYLMPRGFNQLMVDAGYQISDDNLQELMHALIVVALPTRISMQPLVCDKINNIDLTRGRRHYIYEVSCDIVEDGEIKQLDVHFDEFTDQFKGGNMYWGEMQKSGYRERPYSFNIERAER